MSYESNQPRHPWARLTAAARRVSDDRDTAAPYGFGTRIAALAQAQERRVISVLERFSLRAVCVASLLAIFGVALNYQAIAGGFGSSTASVEEVDILSADDAVAIVLDLGD